MTELFGLRATRHDRSVEDEVRTILTDAVRAPAGGPNIAQVITDRFGELGGSELDLPPQNSAPRGAEFGDGDS